MIVPVKEKGREAEIKEKFNVCNLFFLYLHVDMSCFIGGKNGYKNISRKIIDLILYSFAYVRYKTIIRNGNYDIVYINSLTLHRYVLNNKKTVIHIRESLNKERIDVQSRIDNAIGAVFIDRATFTPFAKSIQIPFEVINNPFDMTHVSKIHHHRGIFCGINLSKKTVFSMIGQVTVEKGVLDIVNAFHEIDNKDIVLFIAGNCIESMYKKIKKLCNSDERIVILGHMDNVSILYNNTDYLIRGEKYQCVGRTIFEALFSGCYVLIPGKSTYKEPYEDLSYFNDKIIYYPPGDFSRCRELISECIGKKVIERSYIRNVDRHVDQLNFFFEKVVSKQVLKY
ncbi:MAG: glycosyltransferase [Candidatus Electronema sp. VV]